MIAAVVLAAGLSRRMGEADKLLLPVEGRALYQYALDAGALLPDSLPVVVTNTAEIAREAEKRGFLVVPSPRAQEGMGFSVAEAVKRLPDDAEAALFLNGDQPFVSAELLWEMAALWRKNGGIIVPTLHGEMRAPVLFDREFFGELAALDGQNGGKTVYRRHPERLTLLPWAAAQEFEDVDTRADYLRLLQERQ